MNNGLELIPLLKKSIIIENNKNIWFLIIRIIGLPLLNIDVSGKHPQLIGIPMKELRIVRNIKKRNNITENNAIYLMKIFRMKKAPMIISIQGKTRETILTKLLGMKL